ncbi:MAG: methyltransferase domain-containing protein [Nitrospirae bacterium]|nr:methyltransferase domain-containing protein [Nitrospirota bacterium]
MKVSVGSPGKGNRALKELYEGVYEKGEEKFFSKFVRGKNVSETNEVVLASTRWRGKRVLDVGCGTGTLAFLIARAGARDVVGIDYAESAIRQAQLSHQAPNLSFRCMDLANWKGRADVIVSCGTLEHTDDPRGTIAALARRLSPGGSLILTCPCFLNIRGFIWMALNMLLRVPMSLSDLHFISPFDIERWVAGTSLRLVRVRTFDHSRGSGPLMLADLRKRLTNALRDAKLDNSRVEPFVEWLDHVVAYFSERPHRLEGATALYVLKRRGARRK